MKKILGSMLILAAVASAQPPTIKYNEGVVDQEQSELAFGGCSLGCAVGWSLKTSSELPPSGKNRYGARQLEDQSFKTCWAEGVDGYGIGEFLEYRISDYRKAKNVNFSGFLVRNGYTKTDALWRKNSRVKEMEVTINGVSQGVVTLQDSPKTQFVALKDSRVNWDDVIRFTIKSVYPGSRYKDTCLSEILLHGAH